MNGLTLGSGRRCRWRCRKCQHEWEATVANRAVDSSGCPPCATARLRELALVERAQTPALALARPDVHAEFVRNLTVPGRDIHTTPSGSHDRVLWRCRYGHEWITAARQRVKQRTNCPACRPGFRSSRLEYVVAELLMEATGLTVRVAHEVRRVDRADVERIDLVVEEIQLWVDLDSARSRGSPTALQRDIRKLRRLAERNYVRVRSAALGLLEVELPPGSLARQVVLDHEDGDPEAWLAALLPVVSDLSITRPSFEPLTPQRRRDALGRAARRWEDLHGGERPRSLKTEHPDVAVEFVEVCDRPGLTAADIAPAGNDRVRWRCSRCQHEWVTRTANRTRLGTGCPPCRYRAGARIAARPRAGQSFADLHPELVSHFVENLTSPGRVPTEFRPNSTDLCVWRCPHCSGRWRARPQQLHRRPSGGCGECRFSRTVSTKRSAKRPAPDHRPSNAPSN